MNTEMKRLYRSRADTQLLGICGGIGHYFNIDPVAIRLLWIIGTLLTGIIPGVFAYLLAWLIVPLEPGPPEIVTHAPPPPAGPATNPRQEAQQPGA